MRKLITFTLLLLLTFSGFAQADNKSKVIPSQDTVHIATPILDRIEGISKEQEKVKQAYDQLESRKGEIILVVLQQSGFEISDGKILKDGKEYTIDGGKIFAKKED